MRAAVQGGKADEVGRTLDHGDEAPLIRLRLPSLQCNCRVICADVEEKPLRFGRKIRPVRARNEHRIAAKADRGGSHAHLTVS